MAITTTLKQIIESQPAISVLMDAKLPVKAAYAVSKLAKASANEIEHFNTVRDKLFVDAGCKVAETGEGKSEYVHPEGKEKLDEIVKKVEELTTASTEINALPLDIEQFGNAELPGGAFFGLDWAMKA